VNGTLHLAGGHILVALREKVTLFWLLIFPLFILTVLTLIFGNLGESGEMSFRIAVVNLETTSPGPVDFAAAIARSFVALSMAGSEGAAPLFVLHQPAANDDRSAFIDGETEALRLGDRAALVVIPEGFNEAMQSAVQGEAGESYGATLDLFLSGGRTASDMAASIIAQVLAGLERELLETVGRFQAAEAVATESVFVGADEDGRTYVDYLLPGVLLMGFFTSGLFGIPGTILFNRDHRVLRRYWVTPLTVPRYFVGVTLGQLGLCVIQFGLIYVLGRLAFGATIGIFRPLPLLFLVLAAVTFIALGFLIAAVAKTGNAGMAIANVLNVPLMFLGGLFFPVAGLPLILEVVALVNPITYLADGLRASLDVQAAAYPLAVALAVPAGWILVCGLVTARRLNWDVAR